MAGHVATPSTKAGLPSTFTQLRNGEFSRRIILMQVMVKRYVTEALQQAGGAPKDRRIVLEAKKVAARLHPDKPISAEQDVPEEWDKDDLPGGLGTSSRAA